MAQLVKNPPAMRETWVRSLGGEDPLEEGMQPTPVFWPGASHGQRSLAGYSPWGRKESDMSVRLSTEEYSGILSGHKHIKSLSVHFKHVTATFVNYISIKLIVHLKWAIKIK